MFRKPRPSFVNEEARRQGRGERASERECGRGRRLAWATTVDSSPLSDLGLVPFGISHLKELILFEAWTMNNTCIRTFEVQGESGGLGLGYCLRPLASRRPSSRFGNLAEVPWVKVQKVQKFG